MSAAAAEVEAVPAPTTFKGKMWRKFIGLPILKMVRVVGFVCGVLSILLGFWNLFTSLLLPKSVIFGLYNILFGILMMVSEMRWKRFLKYFKFMTHFIGLGFFYIFVGGLALGSAWYELALGIALLIIGGVYTMFGMCGLRMGSEELPKFMQRKPIIETSSASASPEPVSTSYAPPKVSTKPQPAPRQDPLDGMNDDIVHEHSVSIRDNEFAGGFADAPSSSAWANAPPKYTAPPQVKAARPTAPPATTNKYDSYADSNPFE